MIESVDQLREHLGMDSKQLLQSPTGAVADILGVADGQVTIGVVATGDIIKLPINCFYKKNPNKTIDY